MTAAMMVDVKVASSGDWMVSTTAALMEAKMVGHLVDLWVGSMAALSAH